MRIRTYVYICGCAVLLCFIMFLLQGGELFNICWHAILDICPVSLKAFLHLERPSFSSHSSFSSFITCRE